MVHNDSPDKCSNKKKKQLEKTEVFIRLLPIYHENLKNHLYNNYDISIFRPLLCREIIEFRFSWKLSVFPLHIFSHRHFAQDNRVCNGVGK